MTRKKNVSGYIMLAVAVVLIVGLITGTILVCRTPKTEYEGTITPEDVTTDSAVRYSPETESAFRKDVGTLITKFLQSVFAEIEGLEDEKPVINNSKYVSEPMLELFSKASIPTDKLLALGSYLAGLDTDKMVKDILSYILVVDEEAGTAKFATPEQLANALSGNIDVIGAINQIVQSTSLTADETARLMYEAVLMFSDETARESIETLGRGNFVTLVVSLSSVYDSYISFNVKGGTKNEARLLGELLYATGSEIASLIATVGAKNIAEAFRLGQESAISPENLKAFLEQNGYDASEIVAVEELRDAVESASALTESLLYFAEEAFTSVGNDTLEALADYTESVNDGTPDERYLTVYYAGIARAINAGIEHAVEAGPANSPEEIIKMLAKLKLNTEKFSKNPPSDEEARLVALEEEFSALWADVCFVATKYKDVNGIEAYKALSAAEKAEIDDRITSIRSFDYGALTEGGGELLSVITINVGFNLMSSLIAGAMGE